MADLTPLQVAELKLQEANAAYDDLQKQCLEVVRRIDSAALLVRAEKRIVDDKIPQTVVDAVRGWTSDQDKASKTILDLVPHRSEGYWSFTIAGMYVGIEERDGYMHT